jgi:hypothetical protein
VVKFWFLAYFLLRFLDFFPHHVLVKIDLIAIIYLFSANMYSKIKYEDPHVLSAFLHANHWSEEVVSRVGIGEVIVSAILIHNSYRYFIGAMYTGIIAMIASAGSIFLKTRFTVFIYLVAITIHLPWSQ